MIVDLSIIIVNWNSKEYLRKCLASINANTHNIEFEIIVIDNASSDNVGEMLLQSFPKVQFIQGKSNLGFAKANNLAFSVSHGYNILFLNPDTEIDGSAVETLHCWLESLPNAGIVGAKLLNSDKTIQTSCIRAFPTILNQIFDTDMLRNMKPKAKMLGMGPLFTGSNAPVEVDAVSGASLMIKRSVFESVGMFSNDYFMYSEDIDLCFKVKAAGWNTFYVPTAIIIHHGGTSSSQIKTNAFSNIMMLESKWRFFRKTRSLWYCWFYRLAMFFASISRIGILLIIWPIYILRGQNLSIQKVLQKWTARLKWVLGGESWVKNY